MKRRDGDDYEETTDRRREEQNDKGTEHKKVRYRAGTHR